MRISPILPPGLYSDDTTFEKAGRWADMDGMRFRLGQPQTRGGYETLIGDTLGGVCRNAFPWTDNEAVLNIAFGTHLTLEVYAGGGLYDITPAGLAAGQIDGTGSTGYGTGGYGVGGYGEPSTAEYFPRTWSLAAWGQELLASPRGGKLYTWQNVTSSIATEIANAPDVITHMLVSHTRQAFALGCNEEVSGTFNHRCIRHSDIEDNTGWTTSAATTAREYILPGDGRIVAGRVAGSYLLVFTNNGLFLGQYVGSPDQVWRFDPISGAGGLIGPNAAIIVGQTAYWISPDLQFWSYAVGGAAAPVSCPIREDFADNLAASQADKIVASSINAFSEIRFDYPDARDGLECSRWLGLCVSGPDAGAWMRGQEARTAMVDAGAAPYPIGVTYGGAIYCHELGTSADGGVLSWFIESADQYLSEDQQMMVRCMWPDFKGQVGGVTVTLTCRDYPQGDETSESQVIAVGDDKSDFRITGRLFKVRYEGSSAPAFCRLGKPIFDVAPAGTR